MNRRVIALFAVVPMLIPAQELVRHAVGEPYPAVMMPGFATSPDVGETYTVPSLRLRATDRAGSTVTHSGTDLASDAGVLPVDVLRLMASDGLDAAGIARGEAPRLGLRRALLGHHSGYTKAGNLALIDHPDVSAWFRKRVAGLMPDRDVVRAELVWRDLQIDRTSHDVVASKAVRTVTLFPR